MTSHAGTGLLCRGCFRLVPNLNSYYRRTVVIQDKTKTLFWRWIFDVLNHINYVNLEQKELHSVPLNISIKPGQLCSLFWTRATRLYKNNYLGECLCVFAEALYDHEYIRDKRLTSSAKWIETHTELFISLTELLLWWICALHLNMLHKVFFFLILPSNRLRERGRQAEMNNDTVKIENPQSASPIQRLDSVFINTQYSQSTDKRI